MQQLEHQPMQQLEQQPMQQLEQQPMQQLEQQPREQQQLQQLQCYQFLVALIKILEVLGTYQLLTHPQRLCPDILPCKSSMGVWIGPISAHAVLAVHMDAV
jgi:hypothetical protein